MLTGADERIRCSCCVGMMTTWRDYLLNKCYTHTWMVYVPGLPRDLDYPEVLGLAGRPPAVPDWEPDSDQLASIWRQGSEVLAAFNWNGPARSLVIETGGEVAVRDLWSRQPVEAGGPLLHLDLPESGVRLLKLQGGDRLRAWLE